MAASNTPESYVSRSDREGGAPPAGLSAREERDLKFFFCEWESRAGVKSNFGKMVSAAAGAPEGRAGRRAGSEVSSGDTAFADHAVGYRAVHADAEALTAVESIVNDLWARGDRSWASRAREVRAALERLAGTGHDVVLYRLYGPACSETGLVASIPIDPIIRDAVGVKGSGGDELARLADLTEAAERVREEMACDDGLAREATVSETLVESSGELKAKHEALFWEAARVEAKLAAKIAARRGKRRCKAEVTRVLEARHAAWRDVMKKCLDAHRYDGLVAAKISALAAADKELSASAALRERLRPPSSALHREERERRERERLDLAHEVRKQAEALRVAASVAYRAARDPEFAGKK